MTEKNNSSAIGKLSRARRVVENAFGILSQRFRIYNIRIQLQLKTVDKVVLTPCIK